LISLPEERVASLLMELEECGVSDAAYIGWVTDVGKGHITVGA
jgi:hypothetical protein